VLIGCRVEDPLLDYVDSDNAKAVAEVVDHLVKKGHKKIACITGEVEISQNAADRFREFRKAVARHSLPLPENYVVGGDFGRGSGEEAMKKILALKNRPTAVFACNDQMAMGAWDVMEEAGLKVGKDIALVGFDDVAQASEQSYPLTTVRQDYGAISRLATQTLIDKIQNPDNWRPKHVLIPTQLVVRKSCGAKKKTA
ncbi:MAG TPA: substrate-binding domain-containing protein, partial [bacterium]|nr:substrate-binding domain-containing protein [bacterium]